MSVFDGFTPTLTVSSNSVVNLDGYHSLKIEQQGSTRAEYRGQSCKECRERMNRRNSSRLLKNRAEPAISRLVRVIREFLSV